MQTVLVATVQHVFCMEGKEHEQSFKTSSESTSCTDREMLSF